MKGFLLAMLSFFAFACFSSCEKTHLGEDDENPVGDDVEDSTGDNGGWYGDGDDGDDGLAYLGDTVNVNTFRSYVIYGQVWVKGYIVGAATGAHGRRVYEFGPDFTYDTAILIADTPDAADENETASICLTTCSKSLRERLNLVEHSENKGKFIRVYGIQETYLGLPGIKHIDGIEPSEF